MKWINYINRKDRMYWEDSHHDFVINAEKLWSGNSWNVSLYTMKNWDICYGGHSDKILKGEQPKTKTKAMKIVRSWMNLKKVI